MTKNLNLFLALMSSIALLSLVCACSYKNAGKALDTIESVTQDKHSKNNAPLTPVTQISNEGTRVWLEALTENDMYVGGKAFVPIPPEFLLTFQKNIAEINIPDARNGGIAEIVHIGSASWQDSNLVFLNASPERNIYLYGYNSIEYLGYGLIFDIGEKQTIYTFPFRYMTNTTLEPELWVSESGKELYFSPRAGSGTGVSISELYVFNMDNFSAPYYLDIGLLVSRVNERIDISIDLESRTANVYWMEKLITRSEIEFFGMNYDDEIAPDKFYCGNQIGYKYEENSVKLVFIPVIYCSRQPGVEGNFKSNNCFECVITFDHDFQGDVIGFSLGETLTYCQ